MLLVISPAKTLDMQPTALPFTPSQPAFLDQSQRLIDRLRQLSTAELAHLMHLSDPLAGLNAARYQAWQLPFDATNAKPAGLAFRGDVYEGLAAEQFSLDDWQYAQAHLRILSGLYGLLKPQDWMQAYRLEMGTKLSTAEGPNLYRFWGTQLADSLAAELGSTPLINLASNEYFKAIASLTSGNRVITPVFKDWHGSDYKIISFYAKKARGLMSRFAIRQRLQQAEDLKHFTEAGYGYSAEQSSPDTWVFLRKAR